MKITKVGQRQENQQSHRYTGALIFNFNFDYNEQLNWATYTNNWWNVTIFKWFFHQIILPMLDSIAHFSLKTFRMGRDGDGVLMQQLW